MTTFQSFYITWHDQLRQLVCQLSQAPKPPTAAADGDQIHQLVQKTTSHYADYYRAKAAAAKHDVLIFFSAPWTTPLERSLHWIGGWRPTTAFHLIYTESSILFESHVVDILRGFHTGDLGDLSPAQFRRVSELQCETDDAIDLVGVYGDVDRRLERLAGILEKADGLRLRTINNVVELLTPQQAAEFLVAAAELHFGIRGWGIEQDRQRQRPNN
ncbi:hypothetical protein BUALT_Bualt03G0148200 [Buddleja alternifolia]|uniref:DOG1 domain-containing protein n=1 Tax=Buddleja alternifolia TaxID=168488 RepID=A0AAV6XVK5_9LAMI|nr:hypothetical protein BUALT_Bualt03G0148200 [Buddleja alternifolia]